MSTIFSRAKALFIARRNLTVLNPVEYLTGKKHKSAHHEPKGKK